MCEVISRRACHRDQLCECVAARFSGFGLDRVEDRVFAVENQVVKVTDDERARAQRQPLPAKLRFLRPQHGIANFTETASGDFPNYFTSCGISNFDSISFISEDYYTDVALL